MIITVSGDRNLVSSLSAAASVKISNSFARLSQDHFEEPLESPELPVTSEDSFLSSPSQTPFLQCLVSTGMLHILFSSSHHRLHPQHPLES